MQRRLAILGTVCALGALLSLARCNRHASKLAETVSSATAVDAPAAAKTTSTEADAATPPTREQLLAGLDPSRFALADDGATAPVAEGRTARLTLDPGLQRAAVSLLAQHKLPEAAIVMMDTRTGEVLVYASHVEGGPNADVCARAKAPSASVFKVVTASALVDKGAANAETKQCYPGGGEQRVGASDLDEDPLRDKWCPTLATAMGKSTNTVFARMASKHLSARELEQTARALGYGDPVPFDLPVEPSTLSFPDDKLGFARTAAGFWNTTLSPLEGAVLAATIAHEGTMMRPRLVREVVDDKGARLFGPATPEVLRRAVKRDTASAVTTMMEHTISEGTSYRAFHDGRGRPFVPGITIAGKTGTLNDPDGQHLYTWFAGFAPSHAMASEPQVAISVLVVNQPKWHVKANVIAREMLRAWRKAPEPGSDAVASRGK